MGGGVHLFGSYPSRVHTVVRLQSKPMAALKTGPQAFFALQAAFEIGNPLAHPATAPQDPRADTAAGSKHQQPREGSDQNQDRDGGVHSVNPQ